MNSELQLLPNPHEQENESPPMEGQLARLHEQVQLLDFIQDAVILRDMAGAIIFWNRGAEEMYGWNRAEVLGMTSHIFLQTQFPQPLEEITAALLRYERWEGELVQTRRDGSNIVVSSRWTLLSSSQGDALATFQINSDITERKQAEEALREADRRVLLEYEQLLNRLANLEQELGLARDLTTVFRALLDFLVASVPCNGLFVSLRDSDRQEYICNYAWSEGQEIDVSLLHPMLMNSSPTSRVVSTGEIIVTDDLHAALAGIPRADPELGVGPRLPASSLAVPMTIMGQVVGAFEVQSMELAAYRTEHITATRMAANLAAIAMQNVRLFEDERHLRVQAEAAAQRFSELVQGLDAIVWESDVENDRFIFVSQQAETLLGYPVEQWLSEQEFWINHIHPDDKEQAQTRDWASAISGDNYAKEYRMIAADGKILSLRDIVHVLRDEHGQPRQLRGVIVDITQRKQAEEALRLSSEILQKVNSLVLVSDKEGRITYASPSVKRILGYESEDLLGDGWWRVSTSNSAEMERKFTRLAGVVAGESASDWEPYERMVPDNTGELRCILWQDAKGPGGQIIGVGHDITERKQVEAANSAMEAAKAADQAKSLFLSRMSHELRTPLNAIIGFSQLLEMDDLDPDQMESVELVHKAGRHLLDLINEVLEISHIEAGRMSLSPEPVSVAELVRECLNLVKPIAADKNISLRISTALGCDLYVQADRQRLKQILLNFLSNAVKYNRVGGNIWLSCEEPAVGRVRIAVHDTGAGIAQGKLEKLFTPFERLDADQAGVEGTGLGLALAKSLAEIMGGNTGVGSVVGQGSMFWVELPAASPQEQVAALPPNPLQLSEAYPVGRTVLYIEDNTSNLRLIQHIFTQWPDIRLVSAMQGGSGFALAIKHDPDLVLLDLHLPDVHGEKVLGWLRQHPTTRATPVVIISADATPREANRLLDLGANSYITKPIDVKDFIETIKSTLEENEPSNAT